MNKWNEAIVAETLAIGASMSRALNRGTGRTTMLALDAVKQAIDNLGVEVTVTDHEYGEHGQDELFDKVCNIIAATGMHDMHVRRCIGINGQWCVSIENRYAITVTA